RFSYLVFTRNLHPSKNSARCDTQTTRQHDMRPALDQLSIRARTYPRVWLVPRARREALPASARFSFARLFALEHRVQRFVPILGDLFVVMRDLLRSCRIRQIAHARKFQKFVMVA